jgi:hypothetical protein
LIIEVFNRIEKKYLFDTDTLMVLLKKLEGHVVEDSHSKGRDYYRICNLYYDTPMDELIRNSLEKPAYKEKLRLRSYGIPGLYDKVFLEIKKKYKGKGNKRRILLPLSEAYNFISSKKIPDTDGINEQIANELAYFLNTREICPKLYLSYDRKAFYGADDENLRITFDTNILTRRHDLKLESGSFGDELIKNGQWLMEIKTVGAVPLWLAHILSECEIYPTSFSKYGKEYINQVQNFLEKDRSEDICSNQFFKVLLMQDLMLSQQSSVSSLH